MRSVRTIILFSSILSRAADSGAAWVDPPDNCETRTSTTTFRTLSLTSAEARDAISATEKLLRSGRSCPGEVAQAYLSLAASFGQLGEKAKCGRFLDWYFLMRKEFDVSRDALATLTTTCAYLRGVTDRPLNLGVEVAFEPMRSGARSARGVVVVSDPARLLDKVAISFRHGGKVQRDRELGRAEYGTIILSLTADRIAFALPLGDEDTEILSNSEMLAYFVRGIDSFGNVLFQAASKSQPMISDLEVVSEDSWTWALVIGAVAAGFATGFVVSRAL